MSKTLPLVLTPVHDEEVELHSPNTELLKKKLVHNINQYGMTNTIGMIATVQVNQVGVTVPDSGVWQLCDGSEITNPLSPLRTQGLVTRYTPTYSDRFFRFSNDTTTNNQGGSQSFDLEHNHGGVTGDTYVPALSGESGNERNNHILHNHSISSDLADATNIDYPAALLLAPYMKIA